MVANWQGFTLGNRILDTPGNATYEIDLNNSERRWHLVFSPINGRINGQTRQGVIATVGDRTGPQGAQGPAGPQGERGADGSDASIEIQPPALRERRRFYDLADPHAVIQASLLAPADASLLVSDCPVCDTGRRTITHEAESITIGETEWLLWTEDVRFELESLTQEQAALMLGTAHTHEYRTQANAVSLASEPTVVDISEAGVFADESAWLGMNIDVSFNINGDGDMSTVVSNPLGHINTDAMYWTYNFNYGTDQPHEPGTFHTVRRVYGSRTAALQESYHDIPEIDPRLLMQDRTVQMFVAAFLVIDDGTIFRPRVVRLTAQQRTETQEYV